MLSQNNPDRIQIVFDDRAIAFRRLYVLKQVKLLRKSYIAGVIGAENKRNIAQGYLFRSVSGCCRMNIPLIKSLKI